MMQKNYELTLRAEEDIKDIWLYTAENWNIDQATKYVSLLEKRMELLGKNPEIGAERPDFGDGCRYFLHEQHSIFYRVEDNKISILGIPHSSMDIEKYLSQEIDRAKDWDDRER